MLLSKAWELYESAKRIEGFSPQTLKAYRLQSKLLIQHFNDVSIETLTTTSEGILSKIQRTLKAIKFISSNLIY